MSAARGQGAQKLGVYRHFREQGKVTFAMLEAATRGALAFGSAKTSTSPPRVPGATFHAVAAPPSRALVEDFARHVGDDPARFEGTLPPALFPQWAFPLSARVLSRTGLPLHRILNAGCRVETHAPLLADRPIDLAARLVAYDDDGRRIRMTQEITMRSNGVVAAVAELSTYLPLPRQRDAAPRDAGEKKPPITVPTDATRIATYELGADAGRIFAALTGDVNPIHSVPAIARLAGFRSCILHGFGSFARVHASLARLAEARGQRLRSLDMSFVKPLVLPRTVGLYLVGADFFVGDTAGDEAFARGSFEESTTNDE